MYVHIAVMAESQYVFMHLQACTEQYAEKFYREPLRVNVAVFEHPPYATKADILNGFDPGDLFAKT